MANESRAHTQSPFIPLIEANLYAYYDYLGRSPSAESHSGPEGTWLLTGLSHPFLNGVYRTGSVPERVGPLVEQVIARARAWPVAGLSCWAGAGAGVHELLAKHGWRYVPGGAGMALDLQAGSLPKPAPVGVQIERVATAEALGLWSRAAVAGFGQPARDVPICVDLYAGLGYDLPLRSYLGMRDGEPLAAAQLFVANDVAGIYWVATVPGARQQGLGTALTLAALDDARALGARLAVLHATPLGEPLYRRLGFREYCRMDHFQWETNADLG